MTESIYKSNDPAQTIRTTYLHEGENLKSTQSFTNGKPSYAGAYRYTADANKVDLQNGNRPGTGGRHSAKLIESLETTYPDGKKEKYAYTYELNKNGFVKSLTQTHTDQDGKTSSQVNKYQYVCQ